MKKTADEMAAQVQEWTAEGMDERDIALRVAAWLGSDDEEEAALEAEMLRAEQAIMTERREARGLQDSCKS